jgi:ABC-type polysaccharide/polyol phosphate export permease
MDLGTDCLVFSVHPSIQLLRHPPAFLTMASYLRARSACLSFLCLEFDVVLMIWRYREYL